MLREPSSTEFHNAIRLQYLNRFRSRMVPALTPEEFDDLLDKVGADLRS